jgi:hypothetical protein
MAADPDWSDACAVLEWLRPQYYKVLAGKQVLRVVYSGQEVFYSIANADKLAGLMRQLETECARKNGSDTGRRRAFIAG